MLILILLLVFPVGKDTATIIVILFVFLLSSFMLFRTIVLFDPLGADSHMLDVLFRILVSAVDALLLVGIPALAIRFSGKSSEWSRLHLARIVLFVLFLFLFLSGLFGTR